MKSLLGSDSAILNLVSIEEEWYSPLLVPGKHYIPVRYEKRDNDLEDETDLVHQIKWAQEHPDDVAKIVQHAKQFHAFYITARGAVFRCAVVGGVSSAVAGPLEASDDGCVALRLCVLVVQNCCCNSFSNCCGSHLN